MRHGGRVVAQVREEHAGVCSRRMPGQRMTLAHWTGLLDFANLTRPTTGLTPFYQRHIFRRSQMEVRQAI